MQPLPVDAHIHEIRRILGERRALVVTAPPGSGKTTRIPPSLIDHGRVVLLQPRRVAARSLARRIARERGWEIGCEIGWQIRFERRFSRETRLLVMTEGVLTRKLQSDPLLSDVATVILDEFHERSIHSDLAIALVKQVMRARDDLRVIVMSATLDTDRVAAFLDDAPVVKIAGAIHPVEIVHEPDSDIETAIRESLHRSRGDILCFLPGAGEIRRETERLTAVRPDIAVHQLHGSLGVEEQEAALEPSSKRKVILATNIAETSLTVEGVDTVIDSGLQKVLRFDAGTAIDRLQTERIPLDSADQRAGRAGRLGPGRAVRLWDPRDEMAEHREAEIARIDLVEVLLDVIAWGDDVRTFDWFEAPEPARVDAAIRLLERLGALNDGVISDDGRMLQRLPVHPRLGRILIAASDKRAAARICAIVSDGGRWASRELENLGADVRLLIDRIDRAPQGLRRVARDLEERAPSAASGDDPIERAILRGFPDRVAKRREATSPKLLLSGGQGGVLAGNGATPDSEFMVALNVRASDRNRQLDSLVTLASPIEKDWLVPTFVSRKHRLEGGSVIAIETRYTDSIPIAERRVDVDHEVAEKILVEELRSRPMSDADRRLSSRIEFAGLAVDVDDLRAKACVGKTKLPAFRLGDWIAPDLRRRLDAMAPERLSVPSGRAVPVEYRGRGEAVAAVKLQELFGLAETPRIGPDRTPVTFELLAPNGRPVQVTKDLRSFWERTYPEVRKELRGRYPKHPWPEDPWTPEPTRRAKKRK